MAMSIEARVNKLGLNGLIEDGIHVHSKELIMHPKSTYIDSVLQRFWFGLMAIVSKNLRRK